MKKVNLSKSKLSGEERKQSIIEASIYVFAQKGFHGTFVKDIAKAAGISEALLYQHFTSKEEIYKCISKHIDTDFSFFTNYFKDKEPGGKMLIELVYCYIMWLLTFNPKKKEKRKALERLLIYSHVDNPKQLKQQGISFKERFSPIWDKCIQAAKKNHELKKNIIIKNSMFLMHQLTISINHANTAGNNIIPFNGTYEEFVNETILFSLMGIGLKDEIIEKYYKPEILKKILPEAY